MNKLDEGMRREILVSLNNFDEIKTPKKRIFQVKGLIVDEPLERLS